MMQAYIMLIGDISTDRYLKYILVTNMITRIETKYKHIINFVTRPYKHINSPIKFSPKFIKIINYNNLPTPNKNNNHS